jgi:hypothetical protein
LVLAVAVILAAAALLTEPNILVVATAVTEAAATLLTNAVKSVLPVAVVDPDPESCCAESSVAFATAVVVAGTKTLFTTAVVEVDAVAVIVLGVNTLLTAAVRDVEAVAIIDALIGLRR